MSAYRTESADRWVFWVFLALLVWAPIPLASKRGWGWAILEVSLCILGALWLALYATGRARFPGVFRRAWPAVLAFGLWIGLTALQVLPLPPRLVEFISSGSAQASAWSGRSGAATISVDPESSIQFLLKSFAYFVAFCLTLALASRRSRVTLLAYTIIASGLLQALLGSFLHLRGVDFQIFYATNSHSSNAVGTFINRNHLAGYLEMTLAIGIGMLIATLRGGAKRTWRQRIRDWSAWMVSPAFVLRLSLVAMVICLVMTRSRMGNSAFFASVLVAGAIGLALSRHATRSTVVLLVSLVVIDMFVVGAWFGVEKVVTRLEQTSLTRADKRGEQSVEERVEPGLSALAALKHYRWLGSGGGTFAVVFPRYRPPELTDTYDFAHNDYMQFLTEVGIVGVSLLVFLVAATLWVALRTQYERSDPLARGVAFGVTMGVISLLIHSWVDFNLQVPANALTFTVLLAMGWLAYSVGRHDGERHE